ncbi:MAG: SDR family oxidoreductase [Gemmobacter sp.]|nr:SDR family oxidoreductase [Gemmobacter sp.]
MGRLTGKRALVTAAGQGIGRATAEAFLREGAEVIAADINPATIGTLEGATAQVLDVRDRDAVAQVAAAVGGIDILFNAAGYVAHGTILDCDDDQWDFSVDLNLTAMYRVTRALLPGMLARGGGSIINVASAVGSIQAAPNRFVYGVTKAGVIGLTKAIAADFVAKGIRCNAICPGTVESPSLMGRMEALGATLPGGVDEARRLFLARQPSGRLGTAQEIAALAVYLGSDESAFTTGAAMVVDGGWSNT